MARFKMHLVAKLEQESTASQKQELLKRESGIADDDQKLSVREKNILDYAKDVLIGIVYILFISLVFIGLTTLINPMSREILLGMIQNFLLK